MRYCFRLHLLLILVLGTNFTFAEEPIPSRVDFGLTIPIGADLGYTKTIIGNFQLATKIGFLRYDSDSELQSSGLIKADLGIRITTRQPKTGPKAGRAMALNLFARRFWQSRVESVAIPTSHEFHELGVWGQRIIFPVNFYTGMDFLSGNFRFSFAVRLTDNPGHGRFYATGAGYAYHMILVDKNAEDLPAPWVSLRFGYVLSGFTLKRS